MSSGDTPTDSLVAFRNTRGEKGRGTLLRVTREQVTFELYNPYSIVQTGEILTGLKIRRRDRVIYDGRAVVLGLTPTGTMEIVSARLIDGWRDLAGVGPGAGLREEIDGFIEDWVVNHAIRGGFQLAVSNVRNFLAEINPFLGQIDMAIDGSDSRTGELVREYFEEVAPPVVQQLNGLFAEFEGQARELTPDEEPVHRSFTQRALHPYLLRAPFLHRTFAKPLGYAGDFEMVRMILGDPAHGENTYARVVNAFLLAKEPAIAHRNRIAFLHERLIAEAARVQQLKRPCRIITIGCGPATEIERFLADDLADQCEFDLIDFNEETIEFARGQLARARTAHGRSAALNFIHKAVSDIIKEARGKSAPPVRRYDFVYCAGLFDYLATRVCVRLMGLFRSWLAPGGLIVVTNVHADNPIRKFMDLILEWTLVYRDEGDMTALVSDQATHVHTDSTGVNIFLESRAPEA